MTNIRRFCSNCGGEKILAAREGAAEGGCGGNSAAPERSAGAPHQSKLGAG